MRNTTAFEPGDAGFTVTTVRDNVVQKRFSAAWPPGMKWRDDPEALGEWLRNELKASAISTGACTLIVPRRDVTLRLLEVPRVDDDELVPLVLLQAESRIGAKFADSAIDFVPIGPCGADDVAVLLLSMSRDSLTSLERLASAAGFQPEAAIAADLSVPLLATELGPAISVLRHGSQAELILSDEGRTLGAITISLPDDTDPAAQRIAASIERLKASLPDTLRVGPPTSIRMYGADSGFDADTLCQTLARLADCPVFNMAHEGISSASSARVLAAACVLDRRGPGHDFLHPRKPVDHSQTRRRRIVRWSAVAATLVGLSSWWLYEENCSAADRITQLRAQEKQMAELVERGQAVIEMRSFVTAWQAGNVPWTSKLAEFSEHLPDTDRAYLTRLQLDLESGGTTPVIRASGIAREERDVMQITDRLLQTDGRYELQPHGIEPNLQDPFYKSTFQIEARVTE